MKPYRNFRKLNYYGYSDILDVPVKELEKAPPTLPDEVRPVLLEIPKFSPELENLVNNITRVDSSPYRKAIAIRDYLRSNLDYSLDMEPCPDEKDPVDYFVFEMKKGHCEYFATSLALMLRYSGIPSRLVNGFQRGEVNPFSDAFVVTQADAHSWVEAYFSGIGWIELDATPPVPPRNSMPFIKFFQHVIDSIHFFWMSNVVNFDLGDQFRLFSNMRSTFGNWIEDIKTLYNDFRNTTRSWFNGIKGVFSRLEENEDGSGSDYRLWSILFLIAAGMIASVYAWRVLKNREKQKGNHSVTIIYQQVLKKAEKAGYSRRESETLREFSTKLKGSAPENIIQELNDLYYGLRFGGTFSQEDYQRFEQIPKILGEHWKQK
jgi:hypothetical protein